MCIATLALLAIVCQSAIGVSSDDVSATPHSISVKANDDDTASIPDFDGDGTIGFGDFLIFAGAFGASQADGNYDATYDLNEDGEIGFSDFVIFAQNFGKAAPSPVVTIPDANLRAAIERALGKDSGAPITQADMATLDSLNANDADISDLTGLEFATKLSSLSLNDNDIKDISVLARLTNLERLWLSNNGIEELSALAKLTKLTELWLWNNRIEDISALSGLTGLTRLSLGRNNVTDIAALASLTNLTILLLKENQISDLAPLTANTELANGDTVDVKRNPLYPKSLITHIPALQAKGISVTSDEEIIVFTEPRIYKDNIFVLPIEEDLAGGNLPYRDYAARFYEHFNDEFDFLIFVSNVKEQGSLWPFAAHIGISNDVQGIGLDVFFDDRWQSDERLQSVIYFQYDGVGGEFITNGRYWSSGFGTLIHELMHRWANHIVPPYSHWGFNSQRGWLGAPLGEFRDLGDGKFSIGRWPGRHPLYSPIELYLAGLIPSEDVPDLTIAEDGKFLLDEEGRWVTDEDGNVTITASRIKTYTIEDIVAEHGPRNPDHLHAQKDFRAAVILLVSADFPAESVDLAVLSYEVWHIGRRDEGNYDIGQYPNFFTATGGRATITMDGLSQFKRSAGAIITVPNSFGTPPPPVVDYSE